MTKKLLSLLLLSLWPFINEINAQDLKRLEVTFLPVSIALTPHLLGDRPLNLGGAIAYNLTSHYQVSLQYQRITVKDSYGAAYISDLSDQEVPDHLFLNQLSFSSEENIFYPTDIVGLSFRYNFMPANKVNLFIFASATYLNRQTKIRSVNNSLFDFTNSYTQTMKTATLGYELTDPIEMSDRNNATSPPYLEEKDTFSGGLGAGAEWNIDRHWSLGLQLSLPDLFHRLTYNDVLTIGMTRYNPSEANKAYIMGIEFPDPVQDAAIKQAAQDDNGEVTAYIGQLMGETERQPILSLEIRITYRFLDKK